MSVSAKLRALFARRKLDAEMAEEMRHHVELQTELNRKAGMNSDEARYAALRQFGNVARMRERCREQRRWIWPDQLLQDLRYAARQLRRSPGFAVVAVLSLGLGIGANTAIFSVLDEVLLKTLPVRKPGELALFQWAGARGFDVPISGDWDTDPETKVTTCTSFSLRAFEGFSKSNRTLAALFAFTPLWQPTLVVDGQAESSASGQLVSGDYFTGLGVPPLIGRLITPEDDCPGVAQAAVISHRYWLHRFGGDPAALGKTIRVNGAPATIVGVTPPGFHGALDVGIAPDVSLPLAMWPEVDSWLGPGARKVGAPWMLRVMGRRDRTMTAAQVEANFQSVFQALALEDVATKTSFNTPTEGAIVEPPRLIVSAGGQGLNVLRHGYQRRLMILMGLVALVLLIACVNVSNLLLARGLARRRELAARLALGASRGRLIRQFLTESVLLVGLGVATGVVLACWGRSFATLPFTTEDGKPLVLNVGIDARVLAFTAAIAVITVLIFGLGPALRASRFDVGAGFPGDGKSVSGSSRLRLGRALLVGQVALSLVLLVGSGLFLRTLRKLDAIEVGFNRQQLLLFRINAIAGRADDARAAIVHQRIVDRITSLPGVRSATFSWMPLLSRAAANSLVTIPGHTPAPGAQETATVNAVGPDFFSTLEIPRLLGRGFTARDEAVAPKVAIVNEAFVRTYIGTENPIGRQLFYRARPGPLAPVEIVGVVADTKYADLKGAMPATIYVPFDQNSWSEATYVVRAQGNPEALVPSIRAAVRAVDPNLPVADVRTQEEQIERLSASERLFAWFSSVLGGLALVLVCVGLYGIISYGVTRQTREIGIRIALGARPEHVQWMVVRESLILISIGLGLGIAGALAMTRLVASVLYGVTATDPLTFGAVAGLLMVAALLAVWRPARRAARVDPVVALRAD